MSRNIEMPSLGESITEATISQWLKKEGDRVKVDEPLCELESDKATVDLPSPDNGVLHQVKKAGEMAHVGETIARLDPLESDGQRDKTHDASAKKSARKSEEEPKAAPSAPRPVDADAAKASGNVAKAPGDWETNAKAARKPALPPHAAAPQPPPTEEAPQEEGHEAPTPPPSHQPAEPGTRRVPMSKIRRSIAERLVRAKQNTAMLTTFNEVDMTAIQEVRARNQEEFKKAHGVSLGLMSFFARAAVLALKHFPAINAQIEGGDIVYYDHVHLGIAVSTDRGLVVPILHNAESMSFAKIEQEIKRAAAAAREGKLSIQDLSGGTFTITNGGVFGSLLSTPILNPPQTGILGMHAIQDRPVAIKSEVRVRPMMYVALTYDHRLVDGSDAVSFLVRLKQLLEDPLQMILEV